MYVHVVLRWYLRWHVVLMVAGDDVALLVLFSLVLSDWKVLLLEEYISN